MPAVLTGGGGCIVQSQPSQESSEHGHCRTFAQLNTILMILVIVFGGQFAFCKINNCSNAPWRL